MLTNTAFPSGVIEYLWAILSLIVKYSFSIIIIAMVIDLIKSVILKKESLCKKYVLLALKLTY